MIVWFDLWLDFSQGWPWWVLAQEPPWPSNRPLSSSAESLIQCGIIQGPLGSVNSKSSPGPGLDWNQSCLYSGQGEMASEEQELQSMVRPPYLSMEDWMSVPSAHHCPYSQATNNICKLFFNLRLTLEKRHCLNLFFLELSFMRTEQH